MAKPNGIWVRKCKRTGDSGSIYISIIAALLKICASWAEGDWDGSRSAGDTWGSNGTLLSLGWARVSYVP